ncbi:Muscle M-line assembly protein unc-89 [Nymphon striatum]|nr:Muscle M-line assembly protein unc-89 [Nymphon striatum]
MMCRVTAKNKAIGNYKFVFPAALAESLHGDLRVDTPGKDSIVIPKQVLTSIPGGVSNVLVSQECDEVYLFSSTGDYYPTSAQTPASSLAGSRRNTLGPSEKSLLSNGRLQPGTPRYNSSFDSTDEETIETHSRPYLLPDVQRIRLMENEHIERRKRASSVPADESGSHPLEQQAYDGHQSRRSVSKLRKKKLNLKLASEQFRLSVIAPSPDCSVVDTSFSTEKELQQCEHQSDVVTSTKKEKRRKKLTRMNAVETDISCTIEEVDTDEYYPDNINSLAHEIASNVLIETKEAISRGDYETLAISDDSPSRTSEIIDVSKLAESPSSERKVESHYVTISDYTDKSNPNSLELSEGQIVEVLDSSNENRWQVRTTGTRHASEEGLVSAHYLESKSSITPVEARLGRVISSSDTEEKYREAKQKRKQAVKDLVQTESEFVKDINKVIDSYGKEFDNGPEELKDIKEIVLGNIKDISEFHESVLMEGIEYGANEPAKLGKTFLRLERDFDKHARYCQNEPKAQELISKSSTKRLLQDISDKINDDKSLSEHLKLPIQRINDYQVILKDLIRTSAIMHDSTSDLERALDFMCSITQSSEDVKLMQSIEGLPGSVRKMGQIMKHGWVTATDGEGRTNERYAFLFKGQLFLTEQRNIIGDKKKHITKEIIKLPDVEIVDDGPKSIKFSSSDKSEISYPLKLELGSIEEKETWMENLTAIDNLKSDEVNTEQLVMKPAEAKIDEELSFKQGIGFCAFYINYLTPSQGSSSRSSSYFTATDGENDLKPIFKKTLIGIVCNLGDTISFECNLEDNQTVTWMRNNLPLTELLSPKYEVIHYKNTRALSIKDVQLEDAGLYTAKAINEYGSSTCSARLTVRDAIEIPCSPEPPTTPGGSIIPHDPYFTISFKDTELLEDTCVRFEIKVRGFPDPRVQFFKDGQPLETNDRVYINNEHKEKYELVIRKVLPSDAGKYACTATNLVGKGETSMNVTVTHEKDYFHGVESHKDSDNVNEASVPKFKWFRDGHEFDASERFKIILNEDEDSLALVFQHVKPEDAGLYTCVASTTSGKISCSAELTVQGEANRLMKEPVPPTIIADLTDMEVSIGGSAMLELKISGYPKPQITWYKDGDEIKAGGRFRFLFEDHESSALIIRNAEIGDTGTYTVLARNNLGEVTTSGELLVKVPPSFKKKMCDMSVMTDEPVRFEVEVEANPTPEVKWYKDGQQLSESERVKMMKENDELFAMVIDKARPDDSGSYSCQVSNDAGDISGFSNLSVNDPPSFVRQLKDVNASKNDNISFEAKIAGSPKPDVKWMKDGQEIRADNKHIKIIEEDSTTYILALSEVNESDVGDYSCHISNEYGDVTESARLNLQNVEAREGEEVKFEVKTEGSPTPKIRWYVEDTEIKTCSEYRIDSDDENGTHSLVVKKVTSELTGQYSCKVVNSLGESSSSGSLNMLSEPKFEKKLENQTVVEGESLKLSVKISGTPSPDVKWKRNGEDVTIDAQIKISKERSDVYTLEIEAFTKQFAGEYECTAENSFGKSSSSCTVDASSKAGFDKKFTDKTVSENEDVEFTVKIHGDPKPDVTWKKNGKRVVEDERIEIIIEDENYTLIIRGCITDDSGSYSCKVHNTFGGEEVSAELTVKVGGSEVKPYFTKRLNDTSVYKSETINFEVVIGGSPSPDVTWYKDNVEITESERIKKSRDSENGSYSLTIEDTEPDDTASYTCKASNKYGDEYAEASLTIKREQKEKDEREKGSYGDVPSEPIIIGGEEITVTEHEDIHIKMKVTGDPYPEVLWFKDHAEIKESETVVFRKVIEENELKIIILDCKKSDEGDYECVASNKFGTTSKKSSVTVKTKDGEEEERQKPKFVNNPAPVNCIVGDSAKFDVKVTGNPKPMVKWFHGEEEDELASSDHIILTSNKEEGEFSLTLKECTLEDATTYTCMAINSYGYASGEAQLSVKAPTEPVVSGLKDQEIKVGEKVIINAEVEGTPKPVVKWYKDDCPVIENENIEMISEPSSNKYQLIIKSAGDVDIAKYVLLASNIAGKAAEQANLSFIETGTSELFKGLSETDKGDVGAKVPSILKNLPTSILVDEGKPMILEAKFDGEPSPEIYWKKDGEDIIPNNHIAMSSDPDGNTKLIIESAKPEDSGKYTVCASNDSGYKQSETEANVKSKKVAVSEEPIMKKELQPTELVEGKSGELKAEISGVPKPEVKWLKDGQEIIPDNRLHLIESPEGQVSLLIDEVQPKDAGEYQMVAKNDAGEASSSAPVSVKRKLNDLSIIMFILYVFEWRGYTSRRVNDGDQPGVRGEDETDDIPFVRSINCGEHKVYSDPYGNAKLIIESAKPEDSGKYTVSKKAAVSEEPIMKKELQPTELVEGKTGELKAEISGVPKPEVKWLKDGQEIIPDNRLHLIESPEGQVSLLMDEVRPEDAGEYQMVAKNDAGEASSSAPVSVKPKKAGVSEEPIMKKELQPTELVEGKSGELNAEISGDPKPEVKWLKDGQEIMPDYRTHLIESPEGQVSLLIDKVRPKDAGEYQLVAKNDAGEASSSAPVSVKPKPEEPDFIKKLRPTELKEGVPGKLEAILTGSPVPEAKWTKDGEDIKPDDRIHLETSPDGKATLKIDEVKPEDAGKYELVASNEAGSIKSSAPVTVALKVEEPSFSQGLQPTEVKEGENKRLEVQVTGLPKPVIKWTKDGVSIKPSNRIRIEEKDDGTAALVFDKVTPQDEGIYKAVASNDEGRASTSAPLSVIVAEKKLTAAEFTSELKPTELLEGGSGKVEAEVKGQPKQIIWFKDGEEIIPSDHMNTEERLDGKIALKIDKVISSDAGNYKVLLKSDGGEKASSAPVTVIPMETKVEPNFCDELKPTELTEGEPGVLEAVLTGNPKPKVEWMKDGKPIIPDAHMKPEETPDGVVSLKIDKVEPKDAGEYVVSAENELGDASSGAPVTVIPKEDKKPKITEMDEPSHVDDKKPIITEGLHPTELLAGNPGELILKTSSNTKPCIKWLKDGKEIKPSDHIKMEEKPDGTFALKFDKVSPEDAGKYAAEVSNDKGTSSTSAPITVLEPPMFIQPILPITVKEDDIAKLKGKLSVPLPNIEWFKDDQVIRPDGERIKASILPNGSFELKIIGASKEDQGVYKCVASNAAGEVESKADVKIAEEPKGSTPSIIEGLIPQDWCEGKPGKLSAKIDGEPKPQVKWYKDGKELKNSDRVHMNEKPDGTVSLIIDDVNAGDKGFYELSVSNKNGDVKSTAPVNVAGPPKFLEPLTSEEVVDGDMARLECKVSGFPTPDITWLRNGEVLIPDGIHVQATRRPDGTIALLIDRCKPEDAAKFTCAAKNSGGEASSNGVLKVTERKKSDKPEAMPMILTPLRDLAVKEGEPFSFETRVSGNPLPEVKWSLDGQPIQPSDNVNITFDGKRACLKVKNSNPQHNGNYTIKLVNAIGDVESSAHAKVAARSVPKFVQTLSDTEVKIGDVAELNCKVEGEPEPAITWYYDNYALTPGYKYDIKRDGGNCLLLIKHPRPQKDTGRYECKAKNEMGEDRTSCRLKIMDHAERGEAPIFLKKIGNCEVLEGMSAKFTACISGSPEPDAKWFRNGEELEPSEFTKFESDHHGLNKLIIRKARAEDAGEYRCAISNIHGSAQCTGKLTYEIILDYLKGNTVPSCESFSSEENDMFVYECSLCLDDIRRERPVPVIAPEPMTDKLPQKVRFKDSDKGIPPPLPTAPFIFHMMDDYVSLAWKPSVAYYPRVPVTYAIEMCKLPDGEWTPYKSDFVLRVENKYGVSDPSPYTTAHRTKVQIPSPTPRASKDYEIEHMSPDKMAAAPRFVRKEEDDMYGIRNHPVSIEFWVYGYPQPECTWYFNGDKIDIGIRHDKVQDRNGQITLYVLRMREEDVGNYMCVAVNEHGEARQKIKLYIAEPPIFIKRLEETTVMIRKSGKLQCKITGVPTPTIKWFKDWHPLSDSNRIKMEFTEPDLYTLSLSDAIIKDAGLYSCSAVNIGGHASSSGHITIEESEDQYDLLTYKRPYMVKPRTLPIDSNYDIGDEIGRGTQGIIYHVVKRDTGSSYASKVMRSSDNKFKEWMNNEMDVMSQLNHPRLVRLCDAYETDKSLSLVTEFCGGGELLNHIISKGTLTESDVAHYVRQILEGLRHMHEKRIGHLGLTIGDIFVSKVDGNTIKIGDFGLAARLPSGREHLQEYGHPEYVAPEIANKSPATFASDI